MTDKAAAFEDLEATMRMVENTIVPRLHNVCKDAQISQHETIEIAVSDLDAVLALLWQKSYDLAKLKGGRDDR